MALTPRGRKPNTPPANRSPVKALLHAVADSVAKASLAFGGEFGRVEGTGAYGTPTQAIDKVAEDAALLCLKAHGAKLNILSEEAGFLDRGGTRTLILDPVDGTHNAVRGVPLFATSLAIGDDRLSTVTHGLVRDLVRGTVYYAEKGQGATADGRRIATRAFNPEESVFSVYQGRNAKPQSADVAHAGRRARHLGAASLDLCLVASGAFDAYVMNSASAAQLRIIDIAAGVLIVREAGGVVVDLRRRELEMPVTLKARTNLIAAGDRKALEAIP